MLLRFSPKCGQELTMFWIRRPTTAEIEVYLAGQAERSYSYAPTGGTRDFAPLRHGWDTDRHRVLLGRGEEVFQRAKQAIDGWRMFPAEITTVFGRREPHEGLTVAVLYRARLLPLYLLMPARIVYVIDETVPRGSRGVARYGFAYGTLPDHPECGEERFLVEWDRNDDGVYYDLLAVSRPQHWLVRLGYFYARHQQARFRELSGEAMQEAVGKAREIHGTPARAGDE
jgi:uncharacterized protein (UPF0548 family)